MTSADKSKFRQSKAWKTFRADLLLDRGAKCELCRCKYSGSRKKYLQVHHIDCRDYTDLDPDKFALLCSACHESVEKFITSYFSPLYAGCKDSKYRKMMFDLYYDFSMELQLGIRFV